MSLQVLFWTDDRGSPVRLEAEEQLLATTFPVSSRLTLCCSRDAS